LNDSKKPKEELTIRTEKVKSKAPLNLIQKEKTENKKVTSYLIINKTYFEKLNFTFI